MRVAIIGRSELMYNTMIYLHKNDFEIPLIITAKEASEYTKTAEDFEKFATDINAVFIKTAKINEPTIVEQILGCGKIDLAISINYSGVIAQKIINLFEIGILNAHGGDLPKYRGNACQAWALINGESKIGLCIHKMIGGELDSGDIIEREYLDVDINTRVATTWHWMVERTPELMLKAALKLRKDKKYFLEEQSKDPKIALRCYPRNPNDGRLDWSESNANILRLINASSEPYSGAFCFLEGRKVIIWRAEMFIDDEVYIAKNGQIAKVDNKGLVVICGQGKLLITDIEIDGLRDIPLKFVTSIRKRLE